MSYDEPVNPVQIEEQLRRTIDRIGNSVRVVSDALTESHALRRAYDRAYAKAYLAADGPAHEKKYRAELATVVERDAAEIAEAKYDHARRLARALEKELDALRSVGVSVRATYGGAGIGTP